MREIVIKPGEAVPLGFRGENDATQILFDVTGWAEEFGEGVFQLLARLPGDEDAYTVPITTSGGYVRWIVTSGDTAIAGSGAAQLEYYVSTALAKSCSYLTVVAESLGPSSGIISDAEAWAIGERDGEPVQETDETYHNNAKYYAGEAEASAEQAATSADSALETVRAAGTEQVQRVQAAGETQIQAVAQEGAARQAAVVDEGSTQVQRVQTAGDQAATGVEASIETQGNAQIQRVQDAAGEQIAEITQEGSDQRGAVADAGTAEIQRIQTVGAQTSDAIGDIVEIAEAAQAAATQSASDAEGSATAAAASATRAAGSATAAAASAAEAQTAAERDVPAAAAAWLAEHVDPETGYVLDDSLSIQGAAADAKAAGDAILALSRAPAFSVQSPESLWTIGTLLSSDGKESLSNFRMRTGYLDKAIKSVHVSDGYTFSVYAYTEAGGYIGIWNGEEFRKALPSPPNTAPVYLFELPGDYRYRIVLTRTDSADITTAEGSNLLFAFDTDQSLTRIGIAADAAATGERFDWLDDMLWIEETVRQNINGTVPYIIGPVNKWVGTASTQQTGFLKRIRPGVLEVRVSAGVTSAYVSFLRSYTAKTVVNQGTPDFAPTHQGRIEVPAGTSQAFFVEPGMRYVFVTLTSTSGASFAPESIRFIRLRETIPDTSPMARTIQASIPNIAQPCETAAATLPVQNNKVGVTEYYAKGTVLDGVVYSSVWRDGFDVYWNYTLETYYSALANPASILYTQDYTSRGIDSGHAIMGGVCSTFVSYITNMPHAYTSGIAAKLEDKQMKSVYEIEAGDILFMTGHVAMISQVYCDGHGAIQSVDITEQQVPIARTINILIDALPAYLEDHGYTVKANTFGKPRYLRYDGFAHDIIFERGNNTYVEAADAGEMWFHIPDAPATVYCKANGGDYEAFTLASAPTKTVNDVTVYDLAACFSGVGDYELTTDQEAEKTCLIKIINTGTITIQNGVLNLSGYANCSPKQYQMVPLNVNNGTHTSKAGDPPEGYFCSWGDFAFIESDSQEIEGIPASGRYKLAVDFETGVGLKRVFSANIGV